MLANQMCVTVLIVIQQPHTGYISRNVETRENASVVAIFMSTLTEVFTQRDEADSPLKPCVI